MPPRLSSLARKQAYPSPSHIALQETSICAQLTRGLVTCEQMGLNAQRIELTEPRRRTRSAGLSKRSGGTFCTIGMGVDDRNRFLRG
jgi:hypothetical protein